MDIERELLQDADRVVLDPEVLGYFEGDNPGPDVRADRLREANLLAGLLWSAAEIMTDYLMEDATEFWGAKDEEAWSTLVAESRVLSGLPRRFARQIVPGTVTKFFVVFVDLTARLTQGWRPLSCVAQELMLRALLDEVEVLIDSYELEVDGEWRGRLEDALFEDLDHEMLYDDSLDGFEEDPDFVAPPGMAPMSFDNWFVPFNQDRRLPPGGEDRPIGSAM